MGYEINYITCPFECAVYRPGEDCYSNFVENNISMNICAAMVLNKDENAIPKCGGFHRLFYLKYLAGFAFEGFNLLPPLCILQTVSDNTAVNSVFYNGKIYDPKYGIFSVSEYENKDITVLSYVQMFIPEAYEGTVWRPFIPDEIRLELAKDTELCTFFNTMPVFQQSKILNCIYPFSKPSTFKENRLLSKPISKAKIQQIISLIKSSVPASLPIKSTWEELKEFETEIAVKTLKECGITEGMTVLDLGCGHGHYTYAASIATGENGKVIAADIGKKVLKHVENRAAEFKLNNIKCLKANEKGLSEYKGDIDFIILYDVLHCLFNYTSADWEKKTKLEFLDDLASLLKRNGILSLALYKEIEHKRVPVKTKEGKASFKSIPVKHEEAIKPYIDLIQNSGFKLNSVIENGGVHFDDFHNPLKWRKFGEVKVSALERQNIYNFIKV